MRFIERRSNTHGAKKRTRSNSPMRRKKCIVDFGRSKKNSQNGRETMGARAQMKPASNPRGRAEKTAVGVGGRWEKQRSALPPVTPNARRVLSDGRGDASARYTRARSAYLFISCYSVSGEFVEARTRTPSARRVWASGGRKGERRARRY